MLSLEDQVAVITGASSGIGKAIALGLAKKGVKLCLLGRNQERLEASAEMARKNSPVVKRYFIDLSIDEDVQKLSEKIKVDFKKIDILIHSAGIIFINKLEFASVEEFDLQYKVNVRAPFLITQALLPMLRSGRGQIVFINSSAGLKAGVNNGQYAATKSALKAIADSFRNELNSEEIRFLSVYPGRTATAMQKAVYNMQGNTYKPEFLLQAEDVAAIIINSLRMPLTAEITDVYIRPFLKSY